MTRLSRRAAAAALFALLVVPAPAQDAGGLKVVKYDDLAGLVRDARGKVVVVDLWKDS